MDFRVSAYVTAMRNMRSFGFNFIDIIRKHSKVDIAFILSHTFIKLILISLGFKCTSVRLSLVCLDLSSTFVSFLKVGPDLKVRFV